DDVFEREHRFGDRKFKTELAVDLVTANLGEVVTLGVEVAVVEQGTRSFNRYLLTRTLFAVDIFERVFLCFDRAVLSERERDGFVSGKLFADLILSHAKRFEEHRDGLLTLTIDANTHPVTLIDLEVEPCAPARNHTSGEQVLITVVLWSALK